MKISSPYLLFLGDASNQLAVKTAQGIAQWRPERCAGQRRLPGCRADLGLPDMDLDQAITAGVRTVVLGTFELREAWGPLLAEALARGLDLAGGLHRRLADVPALAAAASRHGSRLFDVRRPARDFAIGTGFKRPGRRLLTVGTDCATGKMYTALALEREMRARGLAADFRATGQTGIFIAGEGVAIDAVVADFMSGAVEHLAPANDLDHWDVIEGQGSLFHCSFAGVSLALLHGAQPDALVLCHDPARRHMCWLPEIPLPALEACRAANLEAARLTNPAVRCLGIALNTSALAPAEADRLLAATAARNNLPAVDPLRTGVGPLVDRLV